MLYPIELEAHVSRLNDLSLKLRDIIYSFYRFRQGGEPGFFKNFWLDEGCETFQPLLRRFWHDDREGLFDVANRSRDVFRAAVVERVVVRRVGVDPRYQSVPVFLVHH